MLVRIWRNWNPCTLLVEMENGTSDIENCVEVPQKTENRTHLKPAVPLLGIISKK